MPIFQIAQKRALSAQLQNLKDGAGTKMHNCLDRL